MALKVTALTSKDFELLEAVGPKSLPDRPTAQGKSAAEIKLALEKPYRFIFNWTQRLANETNEQFSSIEATQKTLADTFSNYVLVTTYSESLKRISDLENKYVTDVTRWAAFDGMGNSIIETYATKSELANESKRSTDAESSISTNLDTESTRAKAADIANSDLVSNETDRAKAAEIANSDLIKDEASRASNAEKANADAIAKETRDRISAVASAVNAASSDATTKSNNALAEAKSYADTKITALVDGADSAYDTLKDIEGQLKSGSDTATALANSISAESNRAKSAEQDNATSISNEETRAKGAESTNATNISNETTARVSADNSLQSNINSEASTRSTAITNLTQRVADEETARANAITNVSQSVTDEASARATGDTNLQNNINSEASARSSADSSEASTRASADISERATANDEYVKNMLHLGAFDTYVKDANGNYVVTRQTGYIKGDSNNLKAIEKSNGGLFQVVLDLSTYPAISYSSISDIESNYPKKTAVDAWASSSGSIAYFPGLNRLEMYATGCDTADNALAYFLANPIFVQYKLSSSYAETYEPNHFARPEAGIMRAVKFNWTSQPGTVSVNLPSNFTFYKFLIRFSTGYEEIEPTFIDGTITEAGTIDGVWYRGTIVKIDGTTFMFTYERLINGVWTMRQTKLYTTAITQLFTVNGSSTSTATVLGYAEYSVS